MDDQERSKVIDSAKKSVAKLETVVQEVGLQGRNVLLQLTQVQQSSPIKRPTDSQWSSFSRPSQHNLEVVVVNPEIPAEDGDEEFERPYEVSISSSSGSDESLNQYLFQRDETDIYPSEVANPRTQSVRKTIAMLKPLSQSPMASPRVLRLPNEMLRSFQLSPIENGNVSAVNTDGNLSSLDLINDLKLKFEEMLTGNGSSKESESIIKTLLNKLSQNMRGLSSSGTGVPSTQVQQGNYQTMLQLNAQAKQESDRKLIELENELKLARKDASKLKEYRDMLKEYQSKINSINEPNEHLSKQLGALQLLVQDKDVQLSNLESQLKQIRESDAKNLLHMASLQREVSSLTNEVHDSKRAARSYQTKNVKLQELLDRAELAVKEKDMELKDKIGECDNIVNEKLETERKLSEAVAEADKAKLKLKNFQAEKERQLESRFNDQISSLSSENRDLKSKYDLLKSQTTQDMQAASEALAKSIDIVKKELDVKEAACSELLSSNRILKDEVEQQIEKNNSLELVHAQIKAKNKDLMKDVKALEADRDTIKQKLGEVETERAQLNTDIASIKKTLEEVKRENHELEATQNHSIISVDKISAEKDAKILELNLSRDVLIQQLTEVRNLNETIAEEMQTLLDHSQVDVSEANAQLTHLKQTIIKQQDVMKRFSLSHVIEPFSHLWKEQNRICKDIESIEDIVDALVGDVSLSDRIVRSKDEEINALITNLSDTQKQLNACNDMITLYSGDILKLKDEKEQLGEIIQELQSKLDGEFSASTSQADYIDDMEKQIAVKDSDIENLKEELEGLQLVNLTLRNEVENFESRLSETKTELEVLTDSKNSLEQQLAEKNYIINGQKGEHEAAVDKLREEIGRISTELDKERSEKKTMKEKLESTIGELRRISTDLNRNNVVSSADLQKHVEVEKLKLDLKAEQERYFTEVSVNEKIRSDLQHARQELDNISPKIMEFERLLSAEKSISAGLKRQLEEEKLKLTTKPLVAVADDKNRLITDLEESSLVVAKLESEKLVLNSRISQLEVELNVASQNHQSDKVVSTLKAEIDNYLKEISSLRKNLEQYRQKMLDQEPFAANQLVSVVQSNTDEISRLKQAMLDQKSRPVETDGDSGISKLLKARVEELYSENRKYSAEIMRLTMEIESHRRLGNEKTAKINSLLHEIENAPLRMEQQQVPYEQVPQLQESKNDIKIAHLAGDLERKNLEVIRLKDDLESIRNTSSANESQSSENYFTRQIDLLKEQNNEKALRISQLLSEISQLRSENVKWAQGPSAKMIEPSVFADQRSYSTEIERIRRQLSDKDKTIEKLSSDLRESAYKNSTLKDELHLKQIHQSAQNDSVATIQRLEAIIRERTLAGERAEKAKRMSEASLEQAKMALSEVELRCSHLMAELSAKDSQDTVSTLKLLSLKSILSSFKSQFKQQQFDIENDMRVFGGNLRNAKQRVEADKMDVEILNCQLQHEQAQLNAAKRTLHLVEKERDDIQNEFDKQAAELRWLKVEKSKYDTFVVDQTTSDTTRNFKNEIRVLKSDLHQTQEFKKVLEGDAERLRSRVKILEERLSEADDVVYRYRRDLQVVNDEMNRMKRSQKLSADDLNVRSSEISRHESFVSQLEEINSELRAKVDDLELLYEEQNVVMERQEKILDNLYSEVESYRKQVQIISSEKRSLESKIDSSVKVVIDYEHLVDNQNTEYLSLQDKINQQAEIIDGLNSSLEIRSHELDLLKRDLESRSELVNRIQGDSQSTIASLKKAHANTISQLNSSISIMEESLTCQSDSLNKIIKGKDEELESLRARFEELEDKSTRIEKEVYQKNIALSGDEDRLQKLVSEQNQLKRQLAKEEDCASAARRELDEQKITNQKLVEEIKDLSSIKPLVEKLVEDKGRLEDEVKKISSHIDGKLELFKFDHKTESDCMKKVDILCLQITKLHRLRDGYNLRITEFENALRHKDDVVSENADYIKELEQELVSLQDGVHEYETRLAEESQSLDAAQESRARLQFQISQLESQLSGKENLLSQKDVSIKEMCEKLASVELEYVQTCNAVKSLRDENDELKKNVVGAEVLSRKNVEILALNDKLSVLQSSYIKLESEHKQHAADYESELTAMREKLHSTKEELDLNSEKFAKLQEQLQCADSKFNDAAQRHEETCSEMKLEIEKLAEDLIRKDGDLNQKVEECRALSSKLNGLEEQLSSISTQHDTSVAEFQTLLADLRKNLDNTLREKESMLTAKDLEINSLVDKIDELEMVRQTASQGEQGLVQLINELKVAQKDLSEALEKNEALLQERDRVISDLRSELDEREESVKELSRKLETDSAKMNAEVAKINDDLQIKQGHIVLMNVQMDELKTENAKLKELESQRKAKEGLINNENLEIVMKELNETKNKFEEYTTINQELDKSNESLRGRVIELQEELKKNNMLLRASDDDKSRMSSELGELKLQKAMLDQTISEVQTALIEMKLKRQQQESLLKQLETKYFEAVSGNAKNQKTDIQDIIQESLKLKDKLESVENLVKKYEVHRKHYKNKIADLEELMAMKESEIEVFSKELIDLRSENERLVQFIARKSEDTQFLIRQLSEAALALREGQQKDANGTLMEHDLEVALNQRSKKVDLFDVADKEFRESVDKIYREQLSIITHNNPRPLEALVSPNIDNHVQNLLFLVEKGEQAIKSGSEIVKTHGKYQKRISKSTQKLTANENRTNSTLFHV